MLDARFRAVRQGSVAGIAPAKLNLFLEVIAHRADGYHELATVFHEIDLADELTVELLPSGPTSDSATRRDDELVLLGLRIDGDPRQNLVLKAARAFREHVASTPPVRITLDKRVPPGTGMGAGSADAAFVLSVLHHCCAPDRPLADLARAARVVGADVGFFLVGGTAMGRGRGDLLEPLPVQPRFTFLVAMPPFPISTAHAYALVDLIAPRRDVCSFAEGMTKDAVQTAQNRAAPTGCFNRLESAAIQLQPQLGLALGSLREITEHPWVMTGSGSALFAPMVDEAEAATAVRTLLSRSAFDVRVVRSFDRHPGLADR